MNELTIRAIILLFVFVAVVLAIEVLVRTSAAKRAQRRGINSRLSMIERGRTYGETLSVLRRSVSTIPVGLPPLLDRRAHKIERTLQQAQIGMPTSLALMILLAAPIVVLALLILVVLFGLHMQMSVGRLFICAAMAFAVGTALPMAILNFKANRMRKRVQEQFPVALDVFVRGLRAGHPVASALELLTVELGDPIGSEFGFVVDEVTYGAQLRDALQNMAERWDLDDIRMFVVSLSVQSETGGNLAEILDNLSKVIRERQSILMKVRALSSEGRMTGLMLSILPVFTFVMLFMFNASFFLDVANDSYFVPGFAMLLMLYLTGVYSIRRMVDLKV
jgi:tight adherence protein B